MARPLRWYKRACVEDFGLVMDATWIWVTVGLLGQACFTARFVVQWLASERRKRSVLPRAFWYFSLVGGVTLLAYALYLGDPVFIVGQAVGLLIYVRNIWFEVEARFPRTFLTARYTPGEPAAETPGLST